MPKKCESCFYFRNHPNAKSADFEYGWCQNEEVFHALDEREGGIDPTRFPNILDAREICDKEGDGIFVHFEPQPATAAIKEVA